MRIRRPGDKIFAIGGLKSKRYQHGKPSAGGVTYLLRDEFTTAESAPLASPRTCEPGPGQFVCDDESSILPGGILSVYGTGAYEGVESADAYAIEAGLCLKFGVNAWALRALIGFRYNLDRNPAITGLGYFSTPPCNVGRFNNAEYVYIVRRDVGSFLIYDQKLVYIDTFNPAKNQKIVAVCAIPATSGGEYSFIRLSLLGSPWDTDYGIATDRLAGARTAGDTFEHEADCLIEAEIDTIPSSDQIELRFRIQDANNYWRVTIDSSGNIDLDEVVSGSPTQRGTSAGVISNSDRIVIIADDETIKVYEANNLRITYTSAANFKTATSGELETEGTGGAVSDIVSWPRALSGAALAALEAV